MRKEEVKYIKINICLLLDKETWKDNLETNEMVSYRIWEGGAKK